MDLGCFRRPLVHSEGAGQSPEIVVIGIRSKDSAERAFIEHDHMVETFPHEWSQSPVPPTLVARESAASIPRQYLCVVPVLGSPGRKCIAISKQVARELVERGTRSAGCCPVHTRRLGGGSH